MRLRCFAPVKKNLRKLRPGGTTVLAELQQVAPATTPDDQEEEEEEEERGWLWHHAVKDTSSAIQALESFSQTVRRNRGDMIFPRLLVLENAQTSSISDSLAYLGEILPVGARVLETLTKTLGRQDRYGRTNAHGNPLDTHVTGICHSFPRHHGLSELAALLDVYPPTRLVVAQSNLVAELEKNENNATVVNPVELEAVMENTDAISINCTTATMNGSSQMNYCHDIWRQIWQAQQRDQCLETYCMLLSSSSTSNANGEDHVQELQKRFQEDTKAFKNAQ